jgi:hypothetical protein
MRKDELLKKIQLVSNDSIESSVNQSKNSSYYIELDKYVTGGGKRIRKNISRESESSSQIPR